VFQSTRIRRTIGVGRATIAVARSEQITFLAAALAYYSFASLVPLLVLTTVVASVVVGDAFATELVTFIEAVLTPSSQGVLQSTLSTTTGRGGATVVGVLTLTWSALRAFRALDTAFSLVYGHEIKHGYLEAVVDGVVAFAAVAVAVVASVGLVSVLEFIELPFPAVVGFVVHVLVLAVAFYPLYYLFPDVEMAYVEAVPGALLAALGWTTLSGFFNVYVENAASFALWGVLGAALILVTWLYVGSLLLLVGATINAVLAGREIPSVETDL
jgi:YihY family inner membrane protein